MTYLDPDLLDGTRDNPRACNDGGGRNGNPTLLQALATLMGDAPRVRVTGRDIRALGEIVGHRSFTTTMSELKQMFELSFTVWMLHTGPDEWILWITPEGEALLK